jgi:hypothetical protein
LNFGLCVTIKKIQVNRDQSESEWRKAMKKLLWTGVVLVTVWLLAPVMARAQSAFDGTWKINLSKAHYSAKPDVYLLKDGVWHCESCVPVINMAVDGKDHKLPTQSPCSEAASMKVVDARTILLTDKGSDGQITATSKGSVSPDGKTLTWESNYSCGGAKQMTSRSVETRVAAGAAGAHAVSGSWRTVKSSGSEDALFMTLEVTGETVTYSDRTGESFSAKLGGPSVVIKGDPNHETASVRLISKSTMETTYRLNGKIVGTERATVAPDGKTLTILATDMSHARTDRVIAEKQ